MPQMPTRVSTSCKCIPGRNCYNSLYRRSVLSLYLRAADKRSIVGNQNRYFAWALGCRLWGNLGKNDAAVLSTSITKGCHYIKLLAERHSIPV